jgi:hypothetical protein
LSEFFVFGTVTALVILRLVSFLDPGRLGTNKINFFRSRRKTHKKVNIY